MKSKIQIIFSAYSGQPSAISKLSKVIIPSRTDNRVSGA